MQRIACATGGLRLARLNCYDFRVDGSCRVRFGTDVGFVGFVADIQKSIKKPAFSRKKRIFGHSAIY